MVTLNVVVIVTDSLRVDHVGYYGSDVETPNIDGLAEECTTFEQASSEGLPTLPTRTTWWTGRYTFPFRGWQPFLNSDLLLAEVLWNRSYKPALISDTYHMHEPVYNCVADSTEQENLVDEDRDIVASLDHEPRRFVDEITPHDAAL
ncbi:MAG: sulfatase-like hydrolase/transferase [Candidatus Bathyarchaeia archaeon]